MELKENKFRLPLLALLLYVPIVHLLGVFLLPELLYASPYGFFTNTLKPILTVPYLADIFPVFFALPPLLGWYRLEQGQEQGAQLFKISVLYTLMLAVLCTGARIYMSGEALPAILFIIAPLVYSLLLWLLSRKAAAENKK